MLDLRSWLVLAFLAVLVAGPSPAPAEIRIGHLEVFLNDQEVTVNATVFGAIPPAFLEPIHSGIPLHVRFTIELWQYTPYWRDKLLTTAVVERNLAYNVVAKEYKVSALKGETRPVYATRDLRDAVRVLSGVRTFKIGPASALGGVDVVYVLVRAETALNGENTFVTRMAGTAEETLRKSEYLTLARIQ